MKAKIEKLYGEVVHLPRRIKALYEFTHEEYYNIKEKLKDLANTNYQLGLYHLNQENFLDAKIRFFLVTKLKPELASAHYQLALCYTISGNLPKAKKLLEQTLSIDPSFSNAAYRLKLLNKSISIEQIPKEIIVEEYNLFASKYENEMLSQRKYKAPETLAKMITTYLPELESGISCLDLGCGTGLVGAYLSELVTLRSLLGIDISPKMLGFAKTLAMNGKSVYSRTRELDLNNLDLLQEKFDLITASMSLCYTNDLDYVFKQLDNLSHKNTILGLVFLKSVDKSMNFNYKNYCWEFSEEFLQDIFTKYNWTILEKRMDFIFYGAEPGLLFVLRKNV